jgi:excisionase family DNA binding protein
MPTDRTSLPERPRRAFTVASLAAEWECSEGVIRKLIADGKLGHFRIGALIRIPSEEVSRFECQNIASNDSGADSPLSIGTRRGGATEKGYEPATVLGLKRKRAAGGPQGATIHQGPWERS